MITDTDRAPGRMIKRKLNNLFFHLGGCFIGKGIWNEDLVDMLMKWRHSGFNVFSGPKIQPGHQNATENLARYIIRASFSQERLTYIPDASKVVYKSKEGKEEKTFGAL